VAAPTRVSVTASAFNASTSPKTLSSLSVQAGDLIVVRASNENAAETFNTPTSTGLTFTAGPNVGSTGSTGRAAVWTAPIASTGTISVALTVGGSTSNWWGFTVSVYRNHGGVGNSGSVNQTAGTGAPSIAITTSAANSAIDWTTADFNAIDGTSRTYLSVNGSPSTEDNYFRDNVHYATYHAYVPDAGTAGAKTVGLSAPTGQKYSGVAIEILPSSSSTPVSATYSMPVDATQAIAAVLSMPVAAVQGIAAVLSQPLEATQLLAAVCSQPVDATQALSGTCSQPYDATASLRAVRSQPWDATGTSSFGGPYGPTLVSTTNQDSNVGAYGVTEQYQRGSFTALGLSWAFYVDDPFSGGAELWYATSSDDGQTWNSQGDIRSVPGNAGGDRAFDVHFDGTYIHLACGDSTGATDLIYVRGTPASDGSISWGADQTVAAADGFPKWEVSINTDASGMPWIAWENWTGGNPTPRVSASTTNNGTWTPRAGHPLDLSDASTAPFDTLCWTYIARLNDAGKVICFFWYEADVYARVWTGSSWASYEGPLDSPSHGVRSEDIAMVTDSVNGLAYLTWSDASTGIYTGIRSTGGSWSIETATSDIGVAIATAIDGAGALHVFYVPDFATSEVHHLTRSSAGSWTDHGAILDVSGTGETIVPTSLEVAEMSRDGRLVLLFQAEDQSNPLNPDNIYSYVLGATAAVGGTGGATSTPVSATYTLRWEALGALAIACVQPLDATAALAAIRAQPWEAPSGVAAVLTQPYDALAGVAGVASIPYEAAGAATLVSATASLFYEAIAAAAAVQSLPVDALAAAALAASIPYEAQAQLLVTASSPIDATTQLLVSRTQNWEALAALLTVASSPWDATGNTVTPISTVASLFYEALGPAVAITSAPYDTGALIAAINSLAYEAPAGLARVVQAPFDATGGAGATVQLLLDATATLQLIGSSAWESVAQLPLVVRSAPYEALGGLVRAAPAFYDSAGQLAAVLVLPWEADGTNPVPDLTMPLTLAARATDARLTATQPGARLTANSPRVLLLPRLRP
jgi:hypothetical protein